MYPPLQYSRSHKRLSLGMPKASPSPLTIIISFTRGTIFLFLYTLYSCLGEIHGPLFHKTLLCFYLLVSSNRLIGVWLNGNYHVGSVKSACLIL